MNSSGRTAVAPSSSSGMRWSGGEAPRHAEPAGGPGGEGEGSVVCSADALDDRQAEADTCVIGAYASGAALKRLPKRGDHLGGGHLARVLYGENHTLRA